MHPQVFNTCFSALFCHLEEDRKHRRSLRRGQRALKWEECIKKTPTSPHPCQWSWCWAQRRPEFKAFLLCATAATDNVGKMDDGPISDYQCVLGSKSALIYTVSVNHHLFNNPKQYFVSEDKMCRRLVLEFSWQLLNFKQLIPPELQWNVLMLVN